jgi:hypothetical protein
MPIVCDAALLLEKSNFVGADWYLRQAENSSISLLAMDPKNSDWKLQNIMTMIARYRYFVKIGNANELKHIETKLKNIRKDANYLNKLRRNDREYIEEQLLTI